MGLLDPPSIRPAFRSSDGSVTNLRVVHTEADALAIQNQLSDGELILITDEMSLEDVMDLAVQFEDRGQAQTWAMRTRAVHGIWETQALVRAQFFGFDWRSQAISCPIPGRTGQTLVNGTVHFAKVSVLRDLAATKFLAESAGTASTGATLLKFGLYELIGNTMTRLVTSADVHASTFTATNTAYTPAFASNYTLDRHGDYWVAVLAVGQTQQASVQGAGVGASGQLLAKTLTGQTDLPATAAWSSLSDTSSLMFLGVSE